MIRFIQAFALSVFLLLFSSSPAPAQTLGGLLSGGKSSSSPSAAATTPDPLHRETPRDSIYNFLESCHKGRFDLGARYLDLHHLSVENRASQGRRLAEDLSKLLDRNSRFEVRQLSDSATGDTGDGLTPNQEALAVFDFEGDPVTLHMDRINDPQSGPIWIVSSESVARIPALAALIEEGWLEKHMPSPLRNIQLIGTPLWVWLSLVLVALVLSAFSRLLSKLVIAILKPFAGRYAKSFSTHRLEALTEPLRLLLSVMVFRACLAFVPASALLRDDLLKMLILLFMLGAASLLMRLVDVVSDTVISRLDHRERALTYSVFPLGIRFVKILVFCFATLIVLQQWGYNTSAILAGVGVGGVAVALAAQKTIENFFGGVSLISDRPVLVGDFCQFGGQVGTVEDIGLRSTRIRTLDRTLVTVPNSQFSTMTLENYAKRDRFWFHPTIRLRRDTSPDQVRQMMEAITAILAENPIVDSAGVPLRFAKISDQSLDLEIFAYILTTDGNTFVNVQTELLLKVLDASHRLGIGLAIPIQEEFNVAVDARVPDLQHRSLGFRNTAPKGDGAQPDPAKTIEAAS